MHPFCKNGASFFEKAWGFSGAIKYDQIQTESYIKNHPFCNTSSFSGAEGSGVESGLKGLK